MSGVTKEEILSEISGAVTAAALPASATLRSASWAIVLNELNRWDGVTNGLTATFPAAPTNGDKFAVIGVAYAPATSLTMDGNGKTLFNLAPALPLPSTPINLPLVFTFDAYTDTWWLEFDFLLLGLATAANAVPSSDSNAVPTVLSISPNSTLARVGAASLDSVDMARFGGAFVYKPSAGVPVGGQGRLFSDWTSLWLAVQLTVGYQVIWIDEDADIQEVLGGSYDFQKRIALAARTGITPTVLTVGWAGGLVMFDGLSDVYGSLKLQNGWTSGAVIYNDINMRTPSLTLHGDAMLAAIAGNFPFIHHDYSANMDIWFKGRANELRAATGPDTAVVAVSNGGNIRLRLEGDKGTVTPGAFSCLDGSNLGSKVTISDYGNPNGLVSKVQNALTGSFGGFEYPNFAPEVFHFQGDLSAAVADDCLISNFVLSLATSKNVPGVIATPDPEVEHIVSHENQLRQIAWISDVALDATTALEILVDGVVVLTTGATVPLVGRVGTQTLLPFNPAPPYASLVVKGPTVNNRVAVRYRAGTVPGKISVRIQ